MDPNANLKKQLELAKSIRAIWDDSNGEGLELEQKDAIAEIADAMADLALALDGWLKSGGFLPQRWAR